MNFMNLSIVVVGFCGTTVASFIDRGVEEGDGEGFFSAITGNVIGTVGTPQGIAGLIFVILIIGGLIIVIVKKRRK